jgi:hypothetical protein
MSGIIINPYIYAGESFLNTKSLAFDGVDDYIVLSSDLSYTDEFTISTWINTPTIPTSVQGYYLGHSTNDNWVQIYLTTSIRFKVGGTTLTFTESGGNDLVAGSWNHILLYRNSSGDIGIYVNGATFSSTQNNTNTLLLDRFGVGKGQEYSGNISEVSIFNYALTDGTVDPADNQIADLYGSADTGVGNPMGLTPLPIAYYKGDRAALGDQWAVPNQVSQDYVFNFDGGNNDNFGASATGISSAITVSAWIKTSTTGIQTIVNEDQVGGAGTRNWNLLLEPGNKIQIVIINTDGSANNKLRSTALEVQDGNWHNIVFTYDGTADADGLKTYVDGGNLESFQTTSTGIITTDTLGVYIGGLQVTGAWPFTGNMSNVAIWNSVLSAPNILTIYNNGTPNDLTSLSPLSWWKLDDSATFSTNWSMPDAGSASNTGTSANMTQGNLIPDTVTRGTSLYSEYSFDFDGLGDYFDFGNPAALQITGALTISAWVKFTGNIAPIVSKYESGSAARPKSFGLDGDRSGGNHSPVFFIYNSGTVYSTPTSIKRVDDGDWHHLLATFKPSTYLRLYIDGDLEQENTTSIPASIDNDSADFVIGAIESLGSAVSFFNGSIDEVAVWNTDQSANVSAIYNNGRPADLTSLSPVSWWRMGENASWNGTTSVWTIKDQIGSNDGTSAGPPNLVGDAPQSFANGLSISMDIDSRIGESGFSSDNALSYNMEYDSRSTSVPG